MRITVTQPKNNAQAKASLDPSLAPENVEKEMASKTPSDAESVIKANTVKTAKVKENKNEGKDNSTNSDQGQAV